MARVHIFGNSIGYGLFGGDQQWSHLLQKDADMRQLAGQRPHIAVLNHCSPGTMLAHILESDVVPANVRCNQRGRQAAVFCIGARV